LAFRSLSANSRLAPIIPPRVQAQFVAMSHADAKRLFEKLERIAADPWPGT
jgi:hypothetical protein